jgi:hypothetical protein
MAVNARRLKGNIGSPEKTSSGDYVRRAEVAPGGNGGWLVTGPVLDLPPGRYRVEVPVHDADAAVAARWDARTEGGGGVALVSQPIPRPPGPVLRGEFSLTRRESVAVRVRLWSGRLAVGGVAVERVLDEETVAGIVPGKTSLRWVGRGEARSASP